MQSSQGPIDWKQYRALVKAAFLMSLRGKKKRNKYARAISIIASYSLSSIYLGWSLSSLFFEPAYLLVTSTVVLFLASFSVINAYPMIMMDEEEEAMLQRFPISRKTIFAARVTNLFQYLTLIGLPFIIPLMVFMKQPMIPVSDVWVYGAVMFFGIFWVTGFFIVVYGVLLLKARSSSRVLTMLQIIFILSLLFLYQTLPSIGSSMITWISVLDSTFAYLFPPAWFTGLYFSIQGVNYFSAQNASVIILAVSTAIILLLLHSRFVYYPKPETARRGPSDSSNIDTDWFYKLLAVFAPRTYGGKAGYDMFQQSLYRDTALRVRLIPVILLPVAVAMYGLFSHQLDSPFHQRILESDTAVHISVLVFFLFVARNAVLTTMYTRHNEATWIFSLVPKKQLHHYAKGVAQGIIWTVCFPLVLIVVIIFTISMYWEEALLQGLFIFVAVRFQIHTLALFQNTVPFSLPEDKLSSANRVIQLLIILPFLMVFLVIHYLTSHNYLLFAAVLLGAEIATQFIARFRPKRTYDLQLA
ncbi:MAG: hypothetical protein GXO82_03960 [Chlorobi bacterium]|nr:hypothetical protein [Chlorobiota bacterium]